MPQQIIFAPGILYRFIEDSCYVEISYCGCGSSNLITFNNGDKEYFIDIIEFNPKVYGDFWQMYNFSQYKDFIKCGKKVKFVVEIYKDTILSIIGIS
jgi:hypothetical protein